MTPMSPLIGGAIVLLASFIIGSLPLVGIITQALAQTDLRQAGTGNIGVSAAFYHGGKVAGILAVLSEAAKGILAVLLARWLLPQLPVFEILALLALVFGRYSLGGGAGTTNVVWGMVAHDWRVALLVALIAGASFTLVRERQAGRNLALALLPAVMWMLYPQALSRLIATLALSAILYWIYRTMPDDLDLPTSGGKAETRKLFRFFRGDRALVTLDLPLRSEKVGGKAAMLSQLRAWGYPVPPGWVWQPGDDLERFVEALDFEGDRPFIARSSAVGEDAQEASAAGQYESVADLTSPEELLEAIEYCLNSYDTPAAIQYRQERGLEDNAMAVVVQEQVSGTFSGVAFSRDPVTRCGDAVAVECLPGNAARVVSGQETPERYLVDVPDDLAELDWQAEETGRDDRLFIDGEAGDVPLPLLRRVAVLARQLERRLQQVPQDIEWSYDGETLWILQVRPITTLLPVWTRQIAAEVIPGFIRPLTWSINRPLTCGVWGDIFTVVLGDRARGLDFTETATLHYSCAYFNASLLGELFLRMGLPPESLAFLTRGQPMSRPSLLATLRNLPGLFRLLRRQLNLHDNFDRDDRQQFAPLLADLQEHPACRFGGDNITPQQSPEQLLDRIERILEVLKPVTYYNILAPLGFAAQKALFQANETELDNSAMPEVAALQALRELAVSARHLLPEFDADTATQVDSTDLFVRFAETPDGKDILDGLEEFLQQFGYLSEVGTDIAVPTWREDPRPVRELLAQLVCDPSPNAARSPAGDKSNSAHPRVQRALNLKGQVAQTYSRLLAELRWSFIALEQLWLDEGLVKEPGDLFFWVFHEVRCAVTGENPDLLELMPELVTQRRQKWEGDRQRPQVPTVTYGTPPMTLLTTNKRPPRSQLSGIGASGGQAEGRIKVVRQLSAASGIDRQTILVVPYTDSGWMPLLARAGGLISEVGGRLSHGAIVAREYGIPAVMDVADATQQLQDGQQVRIDGETGTVDVLE